MKKLLIVAGLLFCTVAEARTKPRFKVNDCLINEFDKDKIDPWQLEKVMVYKITKVGKASYVADEYSNKEKHYEEVIEFDRQDQYSKVSCKKYLGG